MGRLAYFVLTPLEICVGVMSAMAGLPRHADDCGATCAVHWSAAETEQIQWLASCHQTTFDALDLALHNVAEGHHTTASDVLATLVELYRDATVLH